ncbi:MAG: hypothetical protein J5892_05115 [Bacilli bacterium]|nr:hypothetical protein [Bacilli bacterium]
MTNTPKVVVVNKFTPSYRNLNYNYPSQKAVYNSTMNMFDYFADVKKKAFFMLDYFQGKIGKDKEMNIMFENGEYATQEQIEQRKKQYAKYIENSNIDKLVISFPEGYLEQSVDIQKFEKALAKHIIPMFLKKCGYADIKNMSYQFALHTDQDNLHFHLSFAEKKPNYKSYGKKLQYRNAGLLSQKELAFLKNEVEHYIEKEKVFTPLLTKTNKEIEELKKYFNPKDKNFLLKDKEDILLEEKIVKLGEMISEKRVYEEQKIKYNSIKDKEIKKLTNEIKKYLFLTKESELKEDYKNFKSSLNEINNYFIKIAESNNIKEVDNSLIKSKEKYLNNYVLNAIVNHAYYKNKKITENDVIQEIVYKEYKRSKSKSKLSIVTNYLSNASRNLQFKNRYQIRQAVKNINDELEDAQRDFEKLFQSDKEYS